MEDSYGVKRRDTTKGPPLRILSLDGGGVRGYSMLIIVQELMHRTFVETEGRAPRRSEIPKPCEHFDLIVGTGTGGLIALMLGRLRLDLETCKELYVQLTRMVFETDKTIAGIPYRSTLFKASRLEEAIKQCVQAHTVFEREGNDGAGPDVVNPLNAAQYSSAASGPRRNQSNASVVSFSARSPSAQMARPAFNSRHGKPNARLYDGRENRTKTAITAVYKGSPRGAPPALLRSYDSRREPSPEFDCKIWEAGRATCAIGLAFKPIQIGQTVFHDEGTGTFNPAPEALDEAVVNEWPGREVGVFVSVGTGRRPRGNDANQHQWYEGFMGDYAEARRKLIAKIEGCEKIHEYMLREHLGRRNVSIDNYYRLNVEMGVGEFGMNEWHRLGDISTGTRRYMAKDAEQKIIHGITSKLGKIHRQKLRYERAAQGIPELIKTSSSTAELPLNMFELPGDVPMTPPAPRTPPSRSSFESGAADSLHIQNGHSPRSSNERTRPSSGYSNHSPPPSSRYGAPPNASAPTLRPEDADRLTVSAPTPAQFRAAEDAEKIAIMSPDEHPKNGPPRQSGPAPTRIEPPPLPPKTPLPDNQQGGGRRAPGPVPPYPLDDEAPPPPVNMARKPDYRGR